MGCMMDSGTVRVYSITVLSASGCLSHVDRVRSWIRKRFGMLFEKNELSSDRHKKGLPDVLSQVVLDRHQQVLGWVHAEVPHGKVEC